MGLITSQFARILSAVDHFPFCSFLTPALNQVPDTHELAARKAGQDLALRCAADTVKHLQPGWSEKQTARFMRDWLSAHKVKAYFHRPLVFFGPRTRYEGFSRLADLAPTDRVLTDNDVYILDVGPVVEGLATDISICGTTGTVAGYQKAHALLTEIRDNLPGLIRKHDMSGNRVWAEVRALIEENGFDAVHHTSSYSFFGHRLNGTTGFPLAGFLAERGKQTYSEFLARGLAGQLWSGLRSSSLSGIWAVEPHIGAANFGVKFEESLIVTPDHVGWLRDFKA